MLHIKREECGVFGSKKNRETIQKGGEGKIEMGKNKDRATSEVTVLQEPYSVLRYLTWLG